MKAIFQREFLVKAGPAALFGAVCLTLGACAPRGAWPNLATVPPREEAYRLTETRPAAADKATAAAQQKQAEAEVRSALGNIQGDLVSLEQQLAEAKANIQTEIADYENAIRKLAPPRAGAADGLDILTTAQLYLSRLTRTRDNLRTTREKIETHDRELLDLKARIAGLKNAELAAQAGDISGRLARLNEAVMVEASEVNPYAAGELARLNLLSLEDASAAVTSSPTEGRGIPAMVWQPDYSEDAYHAALDQMLAGPGANKAGVNFLVQVVGDEKALADRNTLLIKAMADLLKADVALDHIVFAVKADAAAPSLRLRLYVMSR